MGKMELDSLKKVMLVATVVWFVATSMWMGQDPNTDQEQHA